jgi:hypothetical protein
VGVNNSWRQPTTMADWMRDVEKRLMHEERRPQNAKVTDIVGTGIGAYSRMVEDWNSEGPIVDGFFYSVADSVINSPDDSRNWMGLVQANSIGQGLQRVWEYIDTASTPSPDPGLFTRSFVTNADGTRNYTPWLQGGGGGGGQAGITVQDEGVDLGPTTQLDFTGAGVTATAGTGEVQLTIDGTPHGPASGGLTGTYPAPTLAPGSVGSAQIVDGSIQAGDLAPGVIPVSLVLSFGSPQTSWIGVHNLNQRPVDVTLMNAAGEKFLGTVSYPSVNQVQADFGVAVAGSMLIQK